MANFFDNTVSVLLGAGDGTFQPAVTYAVEDGPTALAMGDLNGDGKTDFALYNNSTGTLYTGISNGVGAFTYKYTLISIGYTYLRLGDFTGDGKADLVVINSEDGRAPRPQTGQDL